MTTKQFLKAEKNLTWEQMNSFILNSGLELELSDSKPYYKTWMVKNNKEIFMITNYIKDLNTNMSEVKFGFNY
jgi:hypothetical protein